MNEPRTTEPGIGPSGVILAVVAAVLVGISLIGGLGACSPYDPYADLPMRPRGYYGSTQILEEQATGCLYVVNTKARTVEAPTPMLTPDGRHMGCRR